MAKKKVFISYRRDDAAGFSHAIHDRLVMCTHLHVDHVGWNTQLENGRWVPTFPNARYVFAEGELRDIEHRAILEIDAIDFAQYVASKP